MEKNSELFKIEDRYCPICGNFIKADSPTHRCSDNDLKKIFKEDLDEDLYEDLDRTYSDKLNEFDEFYNSDNYYDNDTEDE